VGGPSGARFTNRTGKKMKRLVYSVVVMLSLLTLAGCAWLTLPGGDDVTKRPSFRYFDDARCAGYGAVNFWHTLSAAKQAEAISSRGLDVYHIELLSWAEARTDLESVRKAYNDLVDECRLRRVTLFVSVFNDNSHLAKYGNTPWVPSLSYLQSALDIILSKGLEGVIIQPVAETQTSVGSQFETAGRSRLAAGGFLTCYNHGSRPSGPPAGWNFAAYHPNLTGDNIPGGAVCVTDTGSILRTATLDGTTTAVEEKALIMELGGYEKFNPDAVKSYAGKVLNTYHRPCILYGFLHTAIDTAGLDALASVHPQ